MQQHIGGTKAAAWVERITLACSSQVKRAKELEDFTRKPRSLYDVGDPLDVTTRRLMEPFFGYNLGDVLVHHGHQAEEASHSLGARAFTFRGHIFGPRQTLDTSTRAGQGLLAHELTHVIQQTQPYQLPQGRLETEGDFIPPAANQEASSARVVPPGQHPDTKMVSLAPIKSSPSTTNPQQSEAQAQANEQLVAAGLDNKIKSPPQINLEEVANKVYHLIQYDLVLERERATKVGG